MTAAFALTLTLALLAASSAGAHSLRMPLCRFSSLEGMAVDADDSGAAVARSARHALDFAEFDKPLSADEHAFHHHHHRRMARDAADDLEPTIEKHAPTLQEEPLAAPAAQQQPQQQSQVEFFEQGDSQSSDDAQLDDDQEATLGGSLDGLEPLNEGNEELAEAKRAARQSEAFAGLFGNNDADSERPAVPATPQEAELDQQQGAQREGDAPAADSEDFPTPGAIEGDSAAQKNAAAAAAADAEPAAETAAHDAENDDENIPAAGENKSEHAGTKAEAAETKAEAAENKAETKGKTGEAKVETAEAKVETAEAKVETAEDKVKSAEDKVESAETKAESAEAKVESTEAKVESTKTKAETAEAKESSVAAA